jgi:hypothetical protein
VIGVLMGLGMGSMLRIRCFLISHFYVKLKRLKYALSLLASRAASASQFLTQILSSQLLFFNSKK